MSLSFCGYCYFATLNIFFALSLYFSFIIMCFFEAFVRSIHVLCPGCITLQKKMKFSIEDFFSKCDQIRRNLWIWSHLLKKSLKENFIFCTMSSTKLNQLIPPESVPSLWNSAFISAKNPTTILSSSAISYNVFTCQHIPIFIFSQSNKSALLPIYFSIFISRSMYTSPTITSASPKPIPFLIICTHCSRITNTGS